MKRRKFISQSALVTGAAIFGSDLVLLGTTSCSGKKKKLADRNLYSIFQNPDMSYHPFVRWWWNGNKLAKEEISRELRLLKEAGIGGVEINPIEFPHRIEGDDLGISSLTWLSDEWIDMLQHTFAEAKKLRMICDLIVGSGWPFGSENLPLEERAKVVLLNADHIEGPAIYSRKKEEIYKILDPKVTVPYPGRSFEIMSVKLVPDPLSGLEFVKDIETDNGSDSIIVDIPPGKHAVYTVVKVDSFASVINGAPGAAGPILNHLDREAVRKYLDRMSDTIEEKAGPLSKHLRALFTDSMELEGCNWTDDFPEEFKKRNGYDLMPYLPFIMFKVGRLGAVVNDKYGVAKSGSLNEITERVRFDFEFTKAQLLYERFTLTYLEWCSDLGVKSRAQAYGRAFFPLQTSLGYEIPEGESWTTNWLKHRVGEEMPDEDYRRGRAYTMINKYVSSAAHLSGKRIISCEEMTNTYLVFNTSLERLKNGSDQSIISGITHSVWHGFNYSPPDSPYPGWIQYGSYINEQNNWWPYFKKLNTYKARISSLLQNADMYSDIAIVPANNDLLSEMGVQTDPFPEKLNVEYTSLLWEAICKTGGSADYLNEYILEKCSTKEGQLCYGNRKYSIVFLPGVISIRPEALKVLFDFVSTGGKVICIDNYPEKSPGLNNYHEKDLEVQELIKKMILLPGNFILQKRPVDRNFLEWYTEILKDYDLPHYLDIDVPDPFLMQVRYTSDDGSEIFFFSNSNASEEYNGTISFNKELIRGRTGWIWDTESGERYKISMENNQYFKLRLGPAQSQVIVFDQTKTGREWLPFDHEKKNIIPLEGMWTVVFNHCRGKEYKPLQLANLNNLAVNEYYSDFSGDIIYSTIINIVEPEPSFLEISEVYEIARLRVNGIDCGTAWYGWKIFKIRKAIKPGNNQIEIRVTTLMGNYMKSLTDNPTAQYWTNENRKNQPLHQIGIKGKVVLYT